MSIVECGEEIRVDSSRWDHAMSMWQMGGRSWVLGRLCGTSSPKDSILLWTAVLEKISMMDMFRRKGLCLTSICLFCKKQIRIHIFLSIAPSLGRYGARWLGNLVSPLQPTHVWWTFFKVWGCQCSIVLGRGFGSYFWLRFVGLFGEREIIGPSRAKWSCLIRCIKGPKTWLFSRQWDVNGMKVSSQSGPC